MKSEINRMGRIQLFPLLFQNGWLQSSRFLLQARRIVSSGDEDGLNEEKKKERKNLNPGFAAWVKGKPKTKLRFTAWLIKTVVNMELSCALQTGKD